MSSFRVTFDTSSLEKSAKKLKSTVDASLEKAAKKAAAKPTFVSFDETEAMAIPSKKGIQFLVSGPQVAEDIVNSSDIENMLNEQAETAVTEILKDLQNDLGRVLR